VAQQPHITTVTTCDLTNVKKEGPGERRGQVLQLWSRLAQAGVSV